MTILLSLLTNKYVWAGVAGIALITGALVYKDHIYDTGYKAGVSYVQAKDAIVYQAQLSKELADFKLKTDAEKQAAVQAAQAQQKIETVYQDRDRVVYKTIAASPVMNSTACTMSDDDKNALNKAVEDPSEASQEGADK